MLKTSHVWILAQVRTPSIVIVFQGERILSALYFDRCIGAEILTAQHLRWKNLYFERDSSNLMRKTNALGWSNKCASVLRPADMQVDRRSICLKLSLQMQVAHLLFVRFQRVGPPPKKIFFDFPRASEQHFVRSFQEYLTWLPSQKLWPIIIFGPISLLKLQYKTLKNLQEPIFRGL